MLRLVPTDVHIDHPSTRTSRNPDKLEGLQGSQWQKALSGVHLFDMANESKIYKPQAGPQGSSGEVVTCSPLFQELEIEKGNEKVCLQQDRWGGLLLLPKLKLGPL